MLAASAIHAFFVIVVLFAIWLLPSWLVARYAERKGYSFVGFLIAALLLSWVLAFLAALFLRNRRSDT